MIVGPDFVNSLSENNIDISSAWIFTDVDAYSYDYKEVMLQPISSEAVPLTYLKFKVPVTNIEIRSGNTQTSPLLFAGVSFNIDDSESASSNTNSSIQQLSTGVVGVSAPNAVYGVGTISIESAHVNLYSNSDLQGKIETYLITSATFTLTDGLEQYIVADYNSGSPIYKLENNKYNINSSNIVLIRVCWRNGNIVHSIDYDCAGSGLANKIEAAIIQTEPYKKSLDGGLTISETNTPQARTILMTPAIVYAGTFPHSLSAFNSSVNKFTFASVANGVWTYTSGTTQYNNTQFNPTTGLSTLGNNNYGVVWFYRSVGNDVEVFYVLGSEEYPSLAKAQTARMRADLSLLLRDHCILCGRIIIQKGASSGVVENVSDVSFTSSQITNHNDLQNIQGGSVATSEYYHLSAATYNKLTSGFNPAVRGLFSGTSPITYTSATGAISHSTTGTAGTYTKIVTNATGHVTSGSVLTSADIPNLDASKITTGTFDIARIPALPADNVIITTTFSALTSGQQAGIVAGTTVLLSSDGRSFKYSGTGDKTLEASYIYISDQTPDWSIIANRPTNVSYWNNDAQYLTTATGDVRYSLTGHNHNGLYLTSTSALNPANVTQSSSYRFVTDTEKATWNAKQNAITLGTSAQYFRGDLSLATFPTNLSSFSNGPGYVTSAVGNAIYAPIAHTQAWATITSIPVASTSTSGVLTSTDWNIFNNKVSTTQLTNYLPLSGGTLTGALTGTAATFTSLSQFNGLRNLAWFTFVNDLGVIGRANYSNSILSGDQTGDISIRAESGSVRIGVGISTSAISTLVVNPSSITMNGALTGTTAAFSTSVTSKYSGLDTNHFSTNSTYASWGHKSATSATNYAILQNSTGAQTFLNAGSELHLQVANGAALLLTSVAATLSVSLTGIGATFSQDVTTLGAAGFSTSNAVFASTTGSNQYFTNVTSGDTIIRSKVASSALRFGFNNAGTSVFDITPTSASFTGLVTSKYSGLDTNYYSTSLTYASWGHKSATGNTKYAILQNSTGDYTFLNGGLELNLRVNDVNRLTLTSAAATLSLPLTGTTGYFSNSVYAPVISGTSAYGGKGIVKSAAIGFGGFFGTVDTGTLATTVGIIVDETSTQTYYSQKTGGNHSFYINGVQGASITSDGINGVGNLSIANIGTGGIRLYGETVTGSGTPGTSPILNYGFSTIIANTGYVRFPVSIQGAIVVINGRAYGAPVTATTAVVQSGYVFPIGATHGTSISCVERRMFIGDGTNWYEV